MNVGQTFLSVLATRVLVESDVELIFHSSFLICHFPFQTGQVSHESNDK
jgi:hypothetical protein